MSILRSALAAPILIVALGSWALAAEKVFVLKAGTRIRGELLDDKGDSYTVKVGGGKVVILKAQVVKIEDVVVPSPSPSPAVEATAPSQTNDAPRAAARSDGESGTPKGTPDQPLATPLETEEARKLLKAVAAAVRAGSPDAKALEAKLAALPLATLVAVLVSPDDLTDELGRVALRLEGDPAAVRPLLVRGLGLLDPDRPPSRALMDVLRTVGDDPLALLEQALVKRLTSQPGAAQPALVAIAMALGTTRSIPALASGLIAAPSEGGVLASYTQAASRILGRATDDAAVDKVLLDLAPSLSSVPLGTENAEALLSLFTFGHDPRVASVVSKAVERADSTVDVEETGENERVVAFLTMGYRALLVIRSDTTIRRVLTGAGMAAAASHRAAALSVLLDLSFSPDAIRARSNSGEGAQVNRKPIAPPDPVSHEVLSRLADFLDEAGRPQPERKLVIRLLEQFTGQRIGDDAAAWHRYVRDR